MLRGKFGQIGSKLGDGHVVMDAFQQAAFRDHIRAGERIMFLASMGRLKHKRTRNTLAAEPTPRSSCPSEIGDGGCPVSQAGVHGTSVEKSSGGVHTYDCRREGQKCHGETSGGADGHSTEKIGRERTNISSANATSPPRLASKGDYRPHLDHGGRPRSAGLASCGQRFAGHGVRHRPERDAVYNPAIDRGVSAAKFSEEVPQNVGPEVSLTEPFNGVGVARGADLGASSSSSNARPRPVVAESLPATEREPALQRRPNRRKENEGRGGRGVSRKELREKHVDANAGLAAGEDQLSFTSEGGFTASVNRSLQPAGSFPVFGKSDGTDKFECLRTLTTSAGGGYGRPKSANEAVRGVRPPVADALSKGDRFMGAKSIARTLQGHRPTGRQAWDRHTATTAAAVRTTEAAELLMRNSVNKQTRDPASNDGLASSWRHAAVAALGEGRGICAPVRRCSGSAGRANPGERENRDGETTGRKVTRRNLARAASASVIGEVGGSRRGNERFEPRPKDRRGGDGGSGEKHLGGWGLDAFEKPPSLSSRPSTTTGSHRRGSDRTSGGTSSSRRSTVSTASDGSGLSTARMSTARTLSSRVDPSDRASCSSRVSSRKGHRNGDEGASSPPEMVPNDRRTRLLTELEILRKRMESAETLLRKVDRSLSLKAKKRSPRKAARKASRRRSKRCLSSARRASTAVTVGNTSAKFSAGYGAFNLGERHISPRVITHSANDVLDQL